jgi:hypothetical protein
MSLLSKKAVVLLLAAVAGLGAINAQAAKAKEKVSSEKVSMLDGKFTFVQQRRHQNRGHRRAKHHSPRQ